MKNKKLKFGLFSALLVAIVCVCVSVFPNINVDNQNQNNNNDNVVAQSQKNLDSNNFNVNSQASLPKTQQQLYSDTSVIQPENLDTYFANAFKICTTDNTDSDSVKKSNDNIQNLNKTSLKNTNSDKNDSYTIYWKVEKNILSISIDEQEEWNKYEQNASDNHPAWYDNYRGKIEKVIILQPKEQGKKIKPLTTKAWFGYIDHETSEKAQLSQITDIAGMEYLDTSDVENASFMFAGCVHLDKWKWNPETAPLNLNNVTDAYGICGYTTMSNVQLNYIAKQLTNATNLSLAFSSNVNLETIDLSSNTVCKYYKHVLALNKATMNKSKLTEVKLSTINNGEDFTGMFMNNNLLTTIYADEDCTKISAPSEYMFYGCTSLIGGNGYQFDSDKTDGTMAKVDVTVSGDNHQGYFTYQYTPDPVQPEPEKMAINLKYNVEDESYNNYVQSIPPVEGVSFKVQGETILPDPKKEGDFFLGWKLSKLASNNLYATSSVLTPSKDMMDESRTITLDPVWESDIQITVEPGAVSGLVYDKNIHQLITSGEATLGNFQYKLEDEEQFSQDIPSAKNAGEYKINYRIYVSEFQKATQVKNITTSIAKADIDNIVAPTPILDIAVRDYAQDIADEGSCGEGGTMQYAVSTTKTIPTKWSDLIAQQQDAKTYYVYYYAKANDTNYNDSEKAYIECCIYELADYTELTAAIKIGNEKALHPDWYSEKSFDAMSSALDYANSKQVWGEDGKGLAETKQAIVNTAKENLYNAIEALELLPADYTALNEAIAAAESVDQNKYTKASYTNMQDALNAARSIEPNLGKDRQSEIDEATNNLNTAIDSLIERTKRSLSFNPGSNFTIYKGLNNSVKVVCTPKDGILNTDEFTYEKTTTWTEEATLETQADKSALVDIENVTKSCTLKFNVAVKDNSEEGLYLDSTGTVTVNVGTMEYTTISGNNVTAVKYINSTTTGTTYTVLDKVNKYVVASNGLTEAVECTVTGLGNPNANSAAQGNVFPVATYTKLASVYLKSSLTDIYPYAFAGTSAANNNVLAKILPSTSSSIEVKNIKNNAFEYCSSLIQFGSASNKITLNSSLVSLGDCSFKDCNNVNLTTIEAANTSSLTTFGKYVFQSCSNLKSANFENNKTTKIGQGAFLSCSNLAAVALPTSIEELGDIGGANGVFEDCSCLTTVINTNTLKSIGNRTCNNCSSLVQFGTSYGVIQISSNVKNIGELAFNGCSSIKYISVGSNLSTASKISTNIGNYAFSGCTDLNTYVVRAAGANDAVTYGTNVFSNSGSTTQYTKNDGTKGSVANGHAKLVIAGGTNTSKVALPTTGSAKFYNFVWRTSGSSLSMTNGNYYQLASNITETGSWSVEASADCVLDLNGKTLNANASSSSQRSAIDLNGSVKFRLDDTSVWEDPLKVKYDSSKLGKITKGYKDGEYGGAINCNSGDNQTIYYVNGMLVGNTGGQGGGIMLYWSTTLYMYGGKISNNKTLYYGGLLLHYGCPGIFGKEGSQMYMFGGEVSYNTNDKANKAAGIWLNNNKSTFTMYAGKVRENYKSKGSEGGIYECTMKFIDVKSGIDYIAES